MSNKNQINNIENSGNNGIFTEQTIILNVGGIKYETHKSILTAHPNSLLGTMFAERNLSMLHPENGNEHFIDRDGYLFRYIMQYYRTGKIFLPYVNSDGSTSSSPTLSSPYFPLFSLEEIEAEFDFFQIPFETHERQKLSFAINPTVEKLNQFVYALRNIIKEIISICETECTITFSRNGFPPFMNFGHLYVKQSVIMENVELLIKPFGCVGYTFLNKYGTDIGQFLKNEIPHLSWQYGYSQNREQLKLHMSVTNSMDDSQIFKNSCLRFTNVK